MLSLFPLRLTLRLVCLTLLLAIAPAAWSADLREVRLAQHDEFTRVVLELSGRTHYRISNLSEKYQSLIIELYGVQSAPSAPIMTGEEKFAYGAQLEYDPEKHWARLRLKTHGAARVSDYALQDPLRIVLDVYGNAGDAAAAAPASRPAPPAASAPSPSTNPFPSAPVTSSGAWKRTIIIDPGHGGYHKGGWGMIGRNKVWEKDVTISVGEKLERLLKADPRFDVKLTRREDVYMGLRERTARASELSGDLFISLHCNAVEGEAARKRARGFEIWTWNRDGSRNAAANAVEKLENDDPGVTRENNRLLTKMMMDALESQAMNSRRFASAVHGAFMNDSYFKTNDRGIDSARFTVLEVYDMPSILVEMGFISHPEEVKLLFDSSFQDRIARHLYNGIVEYYSSTESSFPRSAMNVAAGGK